MAAQQKNKPRPASELEPRGAHPGPTTLAPAALVPGAAGLKLLVFVAGAVLMGLEIVGSRLLAPFFGNSVFVWGSLISLFLIALSAGYYLGGRVADRRPSQGLLNAILIGVAAWMLAIPAMAGPVCGSVAGEGASSEKWGPFLASAILFLLPSVGMGVASPFAVRLATHAVASVGKTAGTLYALSTFGSIAGTMLTTFVLIPSFGAGTILKGLALALLATALVTFPFANRRAAGVAAAIAAVAGGSAAYAISPVRLLLQPGDKLLVDVDTPYHHISVVESQGGRQLRFDRYTESEVEIAEPHRSRSGYTNYFHLAFLPKPVMRRVLFIGAGGGVGPRTFHGHDPAMEIDVVDIDAKVLELARDKFFLEDSPQIKLIPADGRMFVRSAKPGTYDAIILDAFSIGGRIPFHLVTREFIALCRDRLTPGGVFLMNINSARVGEKAQIFRSMVKTISAVFPENTHAFALYRRQAPADFSTNIILVGINSPTPATRDDWSDWAAGYESRSYVTPDMVGEMLEDLIVTLPDLRDAPVLTDDYAPIETMPF
jgi:spermidine synthase